MYLPPTDFECNVVSETSLGITIDCTSNNDLADQQCSFDGGNSFFREGCKYVTIEYLSAEGDLKAPICNHLPGFLGGREWSPVLSVRFW